LNFIQIKKIDLKEAAKNIKNEIVNREETEEIYEYDDEEKRTILLGKILKILGISFLSSSFIPGLVAIIITAIDGNFYDSMPLIFAFLILLIFGLASYIPVKDGYI